MKLDIKDTLQWQSKGEIIKQIRSLKKNSFTRVLEQISSNLTLKLNKAEASNIHSLLNQLNEVSLHRILDAPETYFRLTAKCNNYDSAINFVNYLKQVISAEQIRLRKPIESSNTIWSALGDFKYVKNFKSMSWENIICAPLIKKKIIVDAFSPVSKRRPDGSFIESHYCSADEKYLQDRSLSFASEVTTALNIINKINPVTYNFILEVLSVIVLQYDDRKTGFSTISSRTCIGQVIFRNSPNKFNSVEVLIDSLIHEAIHSYLYMIEQSAPWMVNIFENDLITSPWTGNLIRIDSFLHACFVWFGLSFFWKGIEYSKHTEIKCANKMYLRAVKGFRTNSLSSLVERHTSNINIYILDEISTLSKLVIPPHE